MSDNDDRSNSYARMCNVGKRVYNMLNHVSALRFRYVSQRGLVLGVYTTEGSDEVRFTPFAQKYNDSTSGELLKQINM